jgi:hypothetical protein
MGISMGSISYIVAEMFLLELENTPETDSGCR